MELEFTRIIAESPPRTLPVLAKRKSYQEPGNLHLNSGHANTIIKLDNVSYDDLYLKPVVDNFQNTLYHIKTKKTIIVFRKLRLFME